MNDPRARLVLFATVALLCGSVACTEDGDVVRDIGVIQIFFVDPAITSQSVPASDEDRQIQVAEWDIQEATLDLSGNVLDLRFGEACAFLDTSQITTAPQGACASGIIIDSNTEPIPATLNLTFTMSVRRAEPVDPDFDDGDGIPFAMDNCPLVANPGQEDADSNGIGDFCRIVDTLTGADILDSDSDGVSDRRDNCVWLVNPNQEDAGILFGDPAVPVLDGIGDACPEEVAEVRLSGNPSIQTSIQIDDFVQPGLPALLAVDFDDGVALQCNWAAGTCALDASALKMCVQSSLIAALLGCP